jgi:hypothetical protein
MYAGIRGFFFCGGRQADRLASRKQPMRLPIVTAMLGALTLIGVEPAEIAEAEDVSAGSAASRYANPEDGRLADDVYRNAYFSMTYPLPQGWGQGLGGPPPSNSGYYVLNTPRPRDGTKATMLIAAQDMFFSEPPMQTARQFLEALARTASPENGMHVEAPPAEVEIAGRAFARLEMIGTPLLSRLVLATDIRCHVVTFSLASVDRALLARLANSLEKISLPGEASAGGPGTDEGGKPAPLCINDYARGENVVRRVEPAPADPRFQKIPVRIVVGTDGKVKHIHVINAAPQQRKNIEEALAQWELKPHLVSGHAVEVETGLVFEFKPGAS